MRDIAEWFSGRVQARLGLVGLVRGVEFQTRVLGSDGFKKDHFAYREETVFAVGSLGRVGQLGGCCCNR